MGKIKVAIATKGKRGLLDEVADFFAKAQTFTIATVDGKRVYIEVIKNLAADLRQGRGRTVVVMLKERGVDTVVASEFGLGALAMLEQQKVGVSKVTAGTGVSDVIRNKLYRKRMNLA